MNRQTLRKINCHPDSGFPPRSTRCSEWKTFHRSSSFREREFSFKDFDISLGDVFERSLQGRPSVEIDSEVLGGTPHIGGTRIPVFMVLDAIEYYGSLNGAQKSYPNLTIEQIKDAVSFAAAVTEHPVDYKIESVVG